MLTTAAKHETEYLDDNEIVVAVIYLEENEIVVAVIVPTGLLLILGLIGRLKLWIMDLLLALIKKTREMMAGIVEVAAGDALKLLLMKTALKWVPLDVVIPLIDILVGLGLGLVRRSRHPLPPIRHCGLEKSDILPIPMPERDFQNMLKRIENGLLLPVGETDMMADMRTLKIDKKMTENTENMKEILPLKNIIEIKSTMTDMRRALWDTERNNMILTNLKTAMKNLTINIEEKLIDVTVGRETPAGSLGILRLLTAPPVALAIHTR
jgi:hypothetical protein